MSCPCAASTHRLAGLRGRRRGCWSPAGFAPVAAQPPPTTLERVQVIATRTPQAGAAVPASVSVVEGADFRTDSLGATLSEKLATVPGLLARNRQNFAQDEQLSIRGFGTRSSFGIRGVRLYRRWHPGDDARRPGPGVALQPRDRRTYRGAARPVLGLVRQRLRWRAAAVHRGRAGARLAGPELAGGSFGQRRGSVDCARRARPVRLPPRPEPFRRPTASASTAARGGPRSTARPTSRSARPAA